MVAITDYQALITSLHADKPKFMAMVGAVTQGFVDNTNFIQSLPAAFDIDQAQWTELDKIGVWVGLDRSLRATAPGLYVQAPPVGIVPLIDADYQILLKGKIGSNNWNGTIKDAFVKLTNIFGETGSVLFMIDNQNMSMIIAIAGDVPSDAFKAALSGGYMQVRPCGILAEYLYPTEPGGPLFGFDVDNEFIGGFDHGVWSSPS